MNKIFFLLCYLAMSNLLMAQDKTDQSPAGANNQRLLEMKSKLDKIQQTLNEEEKHEREVSNKDIMDLLIALDSKLNKLVERQDSMVIVLKEKEKEEKTETIEPGLYYVVVESQIPKDRAEIARGNWYNKLNKETHIKKSKSGTWYYVIISKGYDADKIQNELAIIRSSVPGAWIIKEDHAD